MSAATALIVAVLCASGGADFDAFCDRNGEVTTEAHGRALFALLQDTERLESVYADAEKGNPRAARVFHTLEADYFPDYGRDLAELVSQPPCWVPVLHELSGWCEPNWSFLDFLSRDRPGGKRLRKALFDGYAERLRQLQREERLVLSAMNALVGVGIAATSIREAEAMVAFESSAPKLLATSRGNLLAGAQNLELREIINQLYRKTATVGAGSTADAIRYELRTGELLSRKGHFLKGQERRAALIRLSRSGALDPGDAQIARSILVDLQKALSGQ